MPLICPHLQRTKLLSVTEGDVEVSRLEHCRDCGRYIRTTDGRESVGDYFGNDTADMGEHGGGLQSSDTEPPPLGAA